jgi:hypothetical protein
VNSKEGIEQARGNNHCEQLKDHEGKDIMKCPGQDTRYWKPGAIFEATCPKCGQEVEFFKDDTTRRCKKCGHRFVNPEMDFGCAAYCQYAQQCIGNLPAELISKREDFLKDRVAIEMKRYFGQDFKRIGHAAHVARYAERIVKEEKGDPAVVLCTASLIQRPGITKRKAFSLPGRF